MQAANLTSREVPESRLVFAFLVPYGLYILCYIYIFSTFLSFSANGSEEVKVELDRSGLAKENLSVLRPLVVSFGLSFFMASCLKFIHDVTVFINPVLLKEIIHFSSSAHADDPVWPGVFYSVSLLLVAWSQTCLRATYFYRMELVGLWVKSALISAIYQKSLTVSANAKKGSTSGEIVNLMSVDAKKIMDALPYLNMIWSCPLQITVAIYMLYQVKSCSQYTVSKCLQVEFHTYIYISLFRVPILVT